MGEAPVTEEEVLRMRRQADADRDEIGKLLARNDLLETVVRGLIRTMVGMRVHERSGTAWREIARANALLPVSAITYSDDLTDEEFREFAEGAGFDPGEETRE